MTLPTSGPLTLADIQTEFGGSNPIGLNEYYAGGGLVPTGTTGTYGAVPTSGTLSVHDFYGTSNSYAYAYLFSGRASTIKFGRMGQTAINSSGVLFGCGDYYTYNSGTNTINTVSRIFNMVAANGSSKIIKTSAGATIPGQVKIDSSDNVYYAYLSGTMGVTKYDSSGNLVWGSLGYKTSYVYNPTVQPYNRMVVASNQEIYVGGADAGTPPTKAIITKYTNTNPPTAAWSRSITTGSNPGYSIYSLGLDSSDNLYAAGYGYNTSTLVGVAFFVKYNSAGTLQWQRKLVTATPSTTFVYLYASATNSSGDTMLGGSETGKFWYAKYNASGTIQWQIKSTTDGSFKNIIYGPSGNIYMVGTDVSSTGIYVVKINSSGTVLWQNYLAGPVISGYSTVFLVPAITVDSAETFLYITSYVNLNISGVSDIGGIMFKVPTDGSKTGTSTTVTFDRGITLALTYNTSSLSFGTGAAVDSAGAFTFANVAETIFQTSGDFPNSAPVLQETITNSQTTIT